MKISLPEFLEKAKKKSTEHRITGVDFGKRIATSNGTMFDMSKMYRKVEKLNGQIADLQNRIQKLKDARQF